MTMFNSNWNGGSAASSPELSTEEAIAQHDALMRQAALVGRNRADSRQQRQIERAEQRERYREEAAQQKKQAEQQIAKHLAPFVGFVRDDLPKCLG
jgi:hypothetical protein